MPAARRRLDLKTYLIAALGALTAIAVYVYGPGDVVPQTLIAVMAAVVLDVALRFVTTRRRAVPTGALISGLIIALLLTEGQPWYVPLTAASLAMGSKHLVRWGGRNLFNPAAVGVAISVIVFADELRYGHAAYLESAPRIYYAQSHLRMDDWWFLVQSSHGWTGSASAIAVVLLGVVLVRRLRRIELVASYVVTYVALVAAFAVLGGQDLALRLLLEVFATGVPFFAFFMLTDPATSPASRRGLRIYGGVTALLSFLLRLIVSPVLFLLVALLAANLGLGIWRTRGATPRPPDRIAHLGTERTAAARR